MSEPTFPDMLKELLAEVRGLRLEVEGWRTNANSNADFVLCELDNMIKSIQSFQRRLP